METAYLLPLTLTSAALALVALGYRADRRRGYGPFALGVAAVAGLVAGKFALDSNAAVYGAIAALVGASLWNAWPRTTNGVPFAPTDTLLQMGSLRKEK